MISTDIIQFNEHDYKALCEEMKSILQLEKEVAAKKKELRAVIIENSGGDRLEWGIKVTQITVKGTVDYNKVVTDWNIPKATLEMYRKDTTERWDIRSY